MKDIPKTKMTKESTLKEVETVKKELSNYFDQNNKHSKDCKKLTSTLNHTTNQNKSKTV